jgi:hypothetical protein
MDHQHKALTPVDPNTDSIFETCECGAVRQVKRVTKKTIMPEKLPTPWHLCNYCVMPGFEALIPVNPGAHRG